MEKSRRMNPGLPGPSGETPIWKEPVRGFYTDPGHFVTLSGLDLLRGMLESGRQEGCRRDRVSRDPAWPASDRDN
jgi:hypothetical protein